jgi:hypothetical protein
MKEREYSENEKKKIIIEYNLKFPNIQKRYEGITTFAKQHKIAVTTLRRWLLRHKIQQDFPNSLFSPPPPPKRGRRSTLPLFVELKIIEWVESEIKAYKPVTHQTISNFAKAHYGEDLTPSGTSRLMIRNGYASHKTQKRPVQRIRESYQAEVDAFRAQYATYDASNYYVMDETGLWEDHVLTRSYSLRGTTPEIATLGSGSRDTVVATLCGNGSKLPLYYLKHSQAKTKNKHKKQSKE